ncbi:MAG: leucine--tRNA ligase [Candidatus Andersenbacteria bacterium]|nr:leucine--tRNA ligase [Candidatus Andersenbacteria bacterium]MBI3251002.1 leucine--tRNA ligase [Candidatus Andersenbacteria bacterium]
MPYNPTEIEKKWQKYWKDQSIFTTEDNTEKPKKYILDMFPYPSGSGLHVGHPKGYIATDIFSRYYRMCGYRVLHPMGWDAFGLPAENYAIANKVHPRVAVEKNVQRFKEQLEIIGFDYDWDREINTTDPQYYKWTQWIFLQLLKAGLAYESHEPINWCPVDKTGLANEDVENGRCERCGALVELRPMRQWVLKIRDYAEKLIDGLEELDWPHSIKESQRNWIGRSEGALITFKASNIDLSVFTTRPDTIFGVTYMVIAPEHELVERLLVSKAVKNAEEVREYVEQTKNKSELQRKEDEKEKTGVEIKGIQITNPATGEKVPVFVADYVLMGYGTGAIMAVPAHDERDFAFAKKYNLPIREVISAGELPSIADGKLVNSGEFNGLPSEEAKKKITQWLQEKGIGEAKVDYKLRDWVFSRQRYWGEPIPIIHCETCGVVPVPEKDLPVELPAVEHYEPTGTGESPLANIEEWVNVSCPNCKGSAKRETNTMPQWAGSSWYYLRYMDPKNTDVLVDKEKEKQWMPVDMYVGGAEHATRHLIYARFWHRFLYDQGYVSTSEPFMRLQHVGLISGEDGRKMSKRWGNVINPDDVVHEYGADTLRVYEMFMGPFSSGAMWSTASIRGARRFLERIWEIAEKPINKEEVSDEVNLALHRTIKRVTEGIEQFRFNTGIAAMMELVNVLEKKDFSREVIQNFILILSPFAPHIAEELWQKMGNTESIAYHPWPKYDGKLLSEADVTIPIQINGKVRGELTVAAGADQGTVESKARELPNVQKHLEGKEVRKVIYVQDRLLNIVVS